MRARNIPKATSPTLVRARTLCAWGVVAWCALSSCDEVELPRLDGTMDDDIGGDDEGLDEPALVTGTIYLDSEIETPEQDGHVLAFADIGLIELSDAAPFTFSLDVSGHADGGQVCLDVGPSTEPEVTAQYAVERVDIEGGDKASINVGECYALQSSDETLTLTLKRFQSVEAGDSQYGRIVVGVRRDPNGTDRIDVVTNGCTYCDLTQLSADYTSSSKVMPWREMNLANADLSGVTIESPGQGGGLASADFIFVGDFTEATFDEAHVMGLPSNGHQLGDASITFADASTLPNVQGWGVPCTNATFHRTELTNDITGLNLDSSSLNGACVDFATYSGTESQPKSLQNVDITDTDLHESTFSHTMWEGTTGIPYRFDDNVLNCATFTGTDFRKTDTGVQLEQLYANVKAAWLEDIGLADCHVDLTGSTIPTSSLALSDPDFTTYKDVIFGRFIYNGATILSGQMSDDQERPFEGYKFAAGLTFAYAQVQNWNFSGAVMPSGVPFTNADLRLGTFEGVTMRGADFRSADQGETLLTGAEFNNSDLTEAKFNDLDLSASVTNSQMPAVKFIGSLLHDTDFKGATLDGVSFVDAIVTRGSSEAFLPNQLVNVIFTGANLSGQDLTSKNFQGMGATTSTDFSGAALINVDFTGSQGLVNANFAGAYLQGTNFSGLQLNGATFNGAQVAASSGSLEFDVNDTKYSVGYGPTNFYDTKLENVRCPNGNAPADGCGLDVDSMSGVATPTCDSGDACRWSPSPVLKPELCCVPSLDPYIVCPHRLANGQPCVDNCDCSSGYCLQVPGKDGGTLQQCASVQVPPE